MKINKYVTLLNNYCNYLIRLKELNKSYFTILNNYITLINYLNHFQNIEYINQLKKDQQKLINENNFNRKNFIKNNKNIIGVLFI